MHFSVVGCFKHRQFARSRRLMTSIGQKVRHKTSYVNQLRY
jgi:hypothetical protein